MRLRITQILQEPLALPIGYHQLLQGVIYHFIGRMPEYASLHDKGYEQGKRVFRMFTFSEISGKYKITGQKIQFMEKLEFWVSSPDAKLMEGMAQAIAKEGITWGDREPEDTLVEMVSVTDIGEEVEIKMLSPICVYSTDPVSGITKYHQPGERWFAKLVSDNFRRKYEAYYGSSPDGAVEIKPVLVLPKDKKVVKYKNLFLDGWTGEYRLFGKPEHLEFLHDAGIGSKNSKGFGMFEILDE